MACNLAWLYSAIGRSIVYRICAAVLLPFTVLPFTWMEHIQCEDNTKDMTSIQLCARNISRELQQMMMVQQCQYHIFVHCAIN